MVVEVWVIHPVGMFSAVMANDGTDRIVVRARVREDLVALQRWIPRAKIIKGGGTDYPFRVVVSREEWTAACVGLAEDVTYSNVKDEVERRQGRARHDVYMRVWSALFALESLPKRRRRQVRVAAGTGLSLREHCEAVGRENVSELVGASIPVVRAVAQRELPVAVWAELADLARRNPKQALRYFRTIRKVARAEFREFGPDAATSLWASSWDAPSGFDFDQDTVRVSLVSEGYESALRESEAPLAWPVEAPLEWAGVDGDQGVAPAVEVDADAGD